MPTPNNIVLVFFLLSSDFGYLEQIGMRRADVGPTAEALKSSRKCTAMCSIACAMCVPGVAVPNPY